MNRKRFLASAGLLAASPLLPRVPFFSDGALPDGRPALEQRRFVSDAVETLIEEMNGRIADPMLRRMFSNCFPNTLDTTVTFTHSGGEPDTFVITGDIPAMWLRDSSAQVHPYLRLAGRDPRLQAMLAGVIRRQAACILIDPYANAFNNGPGESPWKHDITDMKPELHERKWEVDSLCYPMRLSAAYYAATADASPFGSQWQQAMRLAVATLKVQQRKSGNGPYRFKRKTDFQTDTVPGNGWGNPIRPVGMICSMFRPSDDATIFPFLIPSNLFAVAALNALAALWRQLGLDAAFAAEADALAVEVDAAVKAYGIHRHPVHGDIYAYEADGYGNRLFMEDANIPGLLSLPYLGAVPASDPVWQNTRNFVLSPDNPYFYKGAEWEGVGGPHAGANMIWPLSIITRGLVSTSPKEIAACIAMLKQTHAGTCFMHEAFHVENPARFTRKWFAWANTLFGEFILHVADTYPQLLG